MIVSVMCCALFVTNAQKYVFAARHRNLFLLSKEPLFRFYIHGNNRVVIKLCLCTVLRIPSRFNACLVWNVFAVKPYIALSYGWKQWRYEGVGSVGYYLACNQAC